MVQSFAITNAITSFRDVQEKFNLNPSADPQFFLEWLESLPELTETEKTVLDRLRNRYFFYAEDGAITEGTIKLIIVSPLLELVGFCDPPFKIRGEQAVKIELEDEETPLQGFIDALVIQERLWVVIIEAKRYGFNVSLAIPQALAYMMGNLQPQLPVFGLATNGEDYIFIKLDRQQKIYDTSDKLTLSRRSQNQLYDVMQVMKRLKGLYGS